MNRYRQEEFNTFPLESGQNQKISSATYLPFEVLLPYHTHPTIKETRFQIWGRWSFRTLVYHLLGLINFWIKSLFLIFTPHLLIDWPVLQHAVGEGNGTPLQYSCLDNPRDGGARWAAVRGVAKTRTRLSDFTFTFHFHALEKEMATHSSVLAWRIPGTAEPGGLPSMESHRVGHDWSDLAAAAAV